MKEHINLAHPHEIEVEKKIKCALIIKFKFTTCMRTFFKK